jgi:NAD(P)-dependent dehydrogenase (short-subunit alcohol dehydrogenase family)
MTDVNFDGRVAIVTGAGGRPSLGRSYAHLLASRGAKVVINDLGVGPDGTGRVAAHADAVAQEINDAGGEAIADTHSVAEEESAKAVVQTALDAWGKVDILVSNAGVVVLAEFDEVTSQDIRRQIDVHVFGTIWMCRAVWPHMKQAGYGRIVCASSGAHLGSRYVTIYGMAKGGILSLVRGLAVEGADHDIKVNAIGPAAATIALSTLSKEAVSSVAPPAELVAPTVAFLVSEDCPASGGYFESSGGTTRFRYFAETAGYGNPNVTPEDIRDHFSEIVDTSTSTMIPESLDHPHSNAIDRKPYNPA